MIRLASIFAGESGYHRDCSQVYALWIQSPVCGCAFDSHPDGTRSGEYWRS